MYQRESAVNTCKSLVQNFPLVGDYYHEILLKQ